MSSIILGCAPRAGRAVMPSRLGEKIRALRKQRGYTLDRLAELTNSSKSWIWELEARDLPRPSAEKIAQIAAALDVTSDYLVDSKEGPPDVDVVDAAFFRLYQGLDPTTKAKLRDIAKLWRTS